MIMFTYCTLLFVLIEWDLKIFMMEAQVFDDNKSHYLYAVPSFRYYPILYPPLWSLDIYTNCSICWTHWHPLNMGYAKNVVRDYSCQYIMSRTIRYIWDMAVLELRVDNYYTPYYINTHGKYKICHEEEQMNEWRNQWINKLTHVCMDEWMNPIY